MSRKQKIFLLVSIFCFVGLILGLHLSNWNVQLVGQILWQGSTKFHLPKDYSTLRNTDKIGFWVTIAGAVLTTFFGIISLHNPTKKLGKKIDVMSSTLGRIDKQLQDDQGEQDKSKSEQQVSTPKQGEVLRLMFDDKYAPVGGRYAVSLFMNDLSRIHARTGSMPSYEINVKGYTDTRLELEHLEDNLSNNADAQTRRFELRRAVDNKRVSGGLPVDLYIAEAIGISARQLRPGRLVWINKHEQYVDSFMTFISLLADGWPQPSDPFDIFPLEETGNWYARMYLTEPEIDTLLSTEGCPSVHHLTREWGLRVMDCPMDIVQKRVIPGLLQSYLFWRSSRPEQLPDEDQYFRDMSKYGIGLH